ncbi:MAG: glycosyltransferase family 2 protein, partial [Anaerolineales bacterium]
AYRCSVFAQLGLFDPALDVGTVTNGGGDLEMYFRVLAEGHTLVYEPNAIVRHRHRREYAQLRRQISCNGNGLYAYFVRSFLAYPRERLPLLWLMIWWLGWWHIRRLAVSFIRPTRFPRDLVWAELRNSLAGLGRYQQARRIAAQIADRFGPLPAAPAAPAPQPAPASDRLPGAVAVRTLDLSRPVPALPDVTPYATVRVFATWQGQLLGQVEVANRYQPLSASRLRQAMVNSLNFKLLETQGGPKDGAAWAKAMAAVIRHYATPESESEGEAPSTLPSHAPVSVVVGTHDRPDDLRECLRALTTQITARPVEIIVVDNNPTSGRTPAVVAEFPQVRLVNEARKGVAYARNAGIHASHGEIIVSVDDDVTMPPDWLENLVAPFARQDVMAVTGNVIPHELETEAQRLFEAYGGLGRGFKMFEVGGDWFESYRLRMPPTWTLGGTANAAFRASIFNNPDIGLMDEALGPGMPSGVGEDIYLFYRILKANCTHVYQPAAYIYHKHRRNPEALRRQIYNYSKGFVSYHLTTLLRDHDLRSLVQLGLELPKAHLWRIKERWRGRSSYPVSFILLEMWGNLAGPWALWQSRLRVQRAGLSAPYTPAFQRRAVAPEVGAARLPASVLAQPLPQAEGSSLE